MAKSKEDFVALGRADAAAGHSNNRPKPPAPGSTGTWQYRAYMEGWETRHDEKAAPKAVVAQTFQRVMNVSKRQRDINKAQAAFFARHARRERLRAAERSTNRARGRENDDLNQYIKRASK